MEWYFVLLCIFGGLAVLMLSGLPVAFSFMLINVIGVIVFWGGLGGIEQLVCSIYDSVVTFALVAVPMFILMGEVMLHSGIGLNIIDVLDKWLGPLPGRLSLLAVIAGALFSTLCGVSMASVAVLGSTLGPEMEKRGYKKSISLGPILGSGGLAVMIPPSVLGVLLGSLAMISIGKILMAIIIPGVLMASLYFAYIILRCWLQPSIAPRYKPSTTPLLNRLVDTVHYVLPGGIIIFLVIGLIFMGIATPSEAAATGAVGCFILVAIHGKLNLEVLKKSFFGTLRITVMIFTILIGAKAFSQILVFSQAMASLTEFTVGLHLAPVVVVISMMVVVLIMGCFMEAVSIMMITIPLFVPILTALGFNLVWFAVIMLINLTMAEISPPFGLSLFVMKGVASPSTTMGDIYRASFPFVGLSAAAIALIIAFPHIALWLPSIMSQ